MAQSTRINRGFVVPQGSRQGLRRQIGTTLIEVLVVIVIFLVGILAVVQIFPKGLSILVLSRNTSMAAALARDQIESLKAHSDQMPDTVVGSTAAGGIDSNRSPNDLGPEGDSLSSNGTLKSGGNDVGDWLRFTGANNSRRVLGETVRMTAPRQVGAETDPRYYGCLMILQFGPVDYDPATFANTFAVYANDLTQHVGVPAADEKRSDDEYYIADAGTSAITIGLPTGPAMFDATTANLSKRTYYLSFSAYVRINAADPFVRRDFRQVAITDIAPTTPDVNGVLPLASVNLSSLLATRYAVTLGSVELGTLHVARGYTILPSDTTNAWESYEPFTCKILNARLGVLLFSPYAFEEHVSGPNGREPLVARVNYNVYDWRILREEFRMPYHLDAKHQLAVGGIKVTGVEGPDGRPNQPIVELEDPNVPELRKYNHAGADNFVLMDLDTGGVYCERDPTTDAYLGAAWITLKKTSGVLSMVDINSSVAGTQADVLLPDGTIREVTVDTRAVRALYRARNEYSVQVFKSSSSYDVASSLGGLSAGQYYTGPESAVRIYFPNSDIGQKVTFGVINYRSGTTARQMLDQDFVVKTSSGEPKPYIDIRDADPSATNLFAGNYGYIARDVKGSSVTVRTLWNPDSFRLTSDPVANMKLLETWGRGWRRSTNETHLQLGEATR